MIVQPDTRSIFNAFFRQRWTFLLIFATGMLAGFVHLWLAVPQYESTSKLLVKFGQDARPEISSQPSGGESSEDGHRELLQSNVKILLSRDLAMELLKNVTIQKLYPELAASPPTDGETLQDAALKRLDNDLVITTESDSDIINISFFNPDPAVAQFALNKFLDLYIVRQSEIYANPQANALIQQGDIAHQKLENAQKRLYEYKNKEGIVSIDEQLSLLLKQRSDLKEALYEKERSFDHYQSNFINEHDPDILAIKKQLSALDSDISLTVKRKAKYDDLTREIQLDEESYKAANTRVDEAEANQSFNQQKITRISVIEQPSLPYKPTRPYTKKVLAICLLVSLAAGFGACIVLETMDQSFSLPDQATLALGLPLLATFAYHHSKKSGLPLELSIRKGTL